jgi:hypothetical protein
VRRKTSICVHARWSTNRRDAQNAVQAQFLQRGLRTRLYHGNYILQFARNITDSSPVARVVWWEWVRFLSDWEILYSRWRPYIMADAISKEW